LAVGRITAAVEICLSAPENHGKHPRADALGKH